MDFSTRLVIASGIKTLSSNPVKEENVQRGKGRSAVYNNKTYSTYFRGYDVKDLKQVRLLAF